MISPEVLAEILADLESAKHGIALAEAKIRAVERIPPPGAPAPAPEPPPPPAAPPGPAPGLANPKAFFDALRATAFMGPELDQGEVDGCLLTLQACAARRFFVAWTADVLATKYHETAGTMRPIREYGRGAGKPYGKPGRNGGQVAYGRGDVQLTWDDNYERADRELGLGGTLIANYDRALEPELAAEICVAGMAGGWFTGKRLSTYLPEVADVHQFANARRIVNALDKAVPIATYALAFQAALIAGGWTR